MKCYYDVLEVDKSASTELIKKAYYKMSLKWHPDKNIDNSAEATEIFQEIQRAYKVLSNSQERSWYDKNRERFLSMKFNDEDELYDLINNIVYQGFGDDENGFYAVYDHVFHVLSEREQESCRIRGEDCEEIPKFGTSNSAYKDTVGQFYSFWESFSTKMSFHWKNKHEINLTYPRDVRRMMEKENTEIRNKSRKEYNRAVQSLVTVLKSRDPRIKLWKEELTNKAKTNEKKAAQMAQNAWERSQKKLNVQNVIPNYGDITVEELEAKLNNLELEHGKASNDFESDAEDFYCVACNKYFRSLASFKNHEKSKNHQKQFAMLREMMIKENEQYFDDLMIDSSSSEKSKEVGEDGEKKEKEEPVIVCPTENNNENEIVTNQTDEIDIVKEEVSKTFPVDISTVQDDNDDNQKSINEKRTEKKKRRKPKSDKSVTTNVSDGNSGRQSTSNDFQNSLSCDRCGTEFGSRNKLFRHIELTGHGTLKSSVPLKNKSKKK